MSAYLITGASSGLGREVAIRIARLGGQDLILPLRNASQAPALVSELTSAGAKSVLTPLLNLASLGSVSAFLKRFNAGPCRTLEGVLFNAGVQSADRIEFTVDGIETTFAVNHLAHLFLMKGLLTRLSAHAIVGWTASGTHDPKETMARLSGFRGAQYTSVARLAQADYEKGVSITQACRDAYATSKLCDIVSARAFASFYPDAATFFSFDPGLMPGTGLARQQGAVARWVWHKVLPGLVSVLPGTSTPAKSAVVLTDLLTGQLRPTCSGAYFDFKGQQLEPAAPAAEAWVAEDVVTGSDALLAAFE